MNTHLLVLLLGIVAVQAQENVQVFRINFDDQQAPSQPLMAQDGPPAFFRRLMIPFFQNIFDDDTQNNEEPAIRVRVRLTEDDQQESPFARFSQMFNRVRGMLAAMQTADELNDNMQDLSSKAHFRGCPIMRACGDDIERVCASARTSDVVGAVPMCLKEHLKDLSEPCMRIISERFPDKAPEDADENVPEPIVPPSGSDNDRDNDRDSDSDNDDDDEQEQPAAAPQKPEVPQSKSVCAKDVETLCKKEEGEGKAAVVACLAAKRDQVSAKCLDILKTKPLFKCAIDVKKHCPAGAKTSRAVMRCLVHVEMSHHSLSKECHDFLAPIIGRSAPSSHPPVPHVKTQHPTPKKASPKKGVPHRVIKAQPDKVTAASHSLRVPSVPAIIGGFAFVVVMALIVIVIRRRRRRQREAAQVVRTVQLGVNPSQAALAATFHPAQEMEL